MDKSPEAFRTISEVADFLDTPAHVLRFWESRFPQIRPVKRAGGRRYYRPGDVALLAGIKKLLHDEGLTIRGVQKILREQGIRHVAGLGTGDASPVYFDADVEAVLSAEYGPKDVLATEDEPSPDAMQSAQIISLETALSRQEAGRTSPPAQTELWPPAPLDQPAKAGDFWPPDPADDAGSANLFDEHDTDAFASALEETEEPPPTDDGDGTKDADGGFEAPLHPVEDAFQSRPDVNTTTRNDQTDEVNAAAEAAKTDSQAPNATQDADVQGSDTTVTVATLLRRTSPDRAVSVQADLIRLRDRLIALRGQVADAARRKAK